MQKCDGVLASGHNVLTFAIPALQPLVLILFVKPARENQDLEIQRYCIHYIHNIVNQCVYVFSIEDLKRVER